MIGRRLSHYDIVAEISRGGMGVVYRGVDVNLGREVAIKILPEDLLHDPERRARLTQEARAASSLEHPHIAVIHEVGEAEGVIFIAMELIRGERLSDTIGRGPIHQARALTLTIEMAEGLARAHEMGVIHRDLKPANVMITDDGHVKIIDFGLAKLVAHVSADAATASIVGPKTGPDMVMGTAAYMSPEQARGARVDHRSDVFALGVTMYEMLSARPAFQGQSSLDTLQAILTQPVPPLSAVAGSPADATADLQRIISKCAAKDPEERYQGMKDLVVDLRAARRRFESSQEVAPVTAVTRPRVSRPFEYKTAARAGVLLVVVAGAAAAWWLGGADGRPGVTPSGKPAVAVLYFENNTGDASLDWMRTGLTDMLVTDLSQSPDFEVLGTDRLVQILQDLKRVDDRVIASDVVQEIALRAKVDNVLVGSYVKAGGTIRISARLQDARSGRIVSAERVEGAGDSGLFRLVDELTRRFKASMTTLVGARAGSLLTAPGAKNDAGRDRGLTEITTASIEAYRYYAEGLTFHERSLSEQAVPLFEKAIEIDPDFAMAHAKLAVVTDNLGLQNKRDLHAQKALERIDRLTTRERYYIEGFYYGLRPETRARSIEAYTRGLTLHPEHQASRHNLGLQLMTLERYAEGIVQNEELLRRGTSTATSYENLVEMLLVTGNTSRAHAVATELLRLQPESPTSHRTIGLVHMAAGRLDEAHVAFERASVLNPLDGAPRRGRFFVFLLQDRWAEAAAIEAEQLKSSNSFFRYVGHMGAGQRAMAQGHGRRAQELWERGVGIEGLAPQPVAAGRNRISTMLLRQGNVTGAVAQAELALPAAANRDVEFETLQVLSMAQSAAGRAVEAERTLARLESRVKVMPGDRETRRIHWTRGAIALHKGDTGRAVAELNKAAGMLPPHGLPLGPRNSHMDLWLDAARANMEAGNDVEAIRLLERIQTAYERTFGMEAWARSFFLLGQLYERRGDQERAQQQYTRFVELWGGGDLQRDWVSEAQNKIGR
ncbi:MAG: protein kinase [Acidobacteria bacterium]|nr:protein kinase [Acidobacteriota bacterium]